MAEILEYIPGNIDYYELDPSEFCINSNKIKYSGANFKIGCAEDIPFSDKFFDYITSVYEVATFFRKHGFIELMRKDIHYPRNSLKNWLKSIMIKIPVLRYYNGGMFFIFQKL